MNRSNLLAVALLMFGTVAAAQYDDRDERRNRDEERGRRREAPTEAVEEAGFIFVDGQYMAPPYRIRYGDSELFINETSFQLSEFDRGQGEGKRRNGGGGTNGRRVLRDVSDVLQGDGAVVLFAGHPAAVFYSSNGCDLLKVLVDDEMKSAFAASEQNWLPTTADREQWTDWINGFDCPAALRERANEVIARSESLIAEHYAKVAADRTLEASAYPLTVIGMVLVVMAIGHLLSFKPSAEAEADASTSPQERRAVQRALALVAALSALDVIWTILVSRTGAMKELNPLGAALIDDPLALIALKAGATFAAITLLFALRQHRVAQQGAWWGCLICTLLTVRWLTFNSMFVS